LVQKPGHIATDMPAQPAKDDTDADMSIKMSRMFSMSEVGDSEDEGGHGRSEPHLHEIEFSKFQDDVYDITVVAAFGGLQIVMEGGPHLIIHPVFPFVGCAALVAIQLVLIFGVALEVDEAGFWERNAQRREELGNSFDMARWTDFALVMVLQCMIFSELYQALKMVSLTLSPCTWNRRPALKDREHVLGRHAFDYAATLIPFTFLAASCKVVVAYLVSTTSLSIILSEQKVTDAIFNSLALTFIMDLDEVIWKIVSSTTDVKICDPADTKDSFMFKHEFRRKRFPGLMSESGVRQVLVSLALGYVFIDQATVTLASLATGWLPTTRMICGMWRSSTPWAHPDAVIVEEGGGWGAKNLRSILKHCDEHDFHTWHMAKFEKVISNHPKAWFFSLLLVLGFIVLPQLVKFSMSAIIKSRRQQQQLQQQEQQRVTMNPACFDDSESTSSSE